MAKHLLNWQQYWGLSWPLGFIASCTLLACSEEAVTTTMSRLAPAFGATFGKAFITASPHYLEVILLQSVVVFVPIFIVWAWLLGRYRFAATSVFLLFGLAGFWCEWRFANYESGHWLGIGMWVLVYGLMVYLPALAIPANPLQDKRIASRWWHGIMAVILPQLAAIPVVLIVVWIQPWLGPLINPQGPFIPY